MTLTTNRKETMAKKFNETLEDLHHGDLSEQLGIDLADVVKAVMETGKKGALILKLDVKRTGLKKCVVDTTIKTSIPRDDLPTQAMFATLDGDLQLDNPDQLNFPFRNARDRAPLREVKGKEIEPNDTEAAAAGE